MSKSLQRVILLLFLGIGFGIYAVYQIRSGPDADHVALGIVYLVPSIAAFVALLMLPAKPVQ